CPLRGSSTQRGRRGEGEVRLSVPTARARLGTPEGGRREAQGREGTKGARRKGARHKGSEAQRERGTRKSRATARGATKKTSRSRQWVGRSRTEGEPQWPRRNLIVRSRTATLARLATWTTARPR